VKICLKGGLKMGSAEEIKKINAILLIVISSMKKG
jgi:hypothetical protein